MEQQSSKPVRVFVVWEPVLPTDWMAPSTATLRRVPDIQAQQYWDKGRLLSKAMGEQDKSSIVWDRVAVYAPGLAWGEGAPPQASFEEGPVVRVLPAFAAAVKQAATNLQNSVSK